MRVATNRLRALTMVRIATAVGVAVFGGLGARAESSHRPQEPTIRLAATMAECQRALQDAVAICDRLFNSSGSTTTYRNTQWHSTCLSNARTKFDNCRSTVGQ